MWFAGRLAKAWVRHHFLVDILINQISETTTNTYLTYLGNVSNVRPGACSTPSEPSTTVDNSPLLHGGGLSTVAGWRLPSGVAVVLFGVLRGVFLAL